MSLWGNTIENAIQSKTEKSKTKADRERKVHLVLNKYLYCDSPDSAQGRFRDPMAMRTSR